MKLPQLILTIALAATVGSIAFSATASPATAQIPPPTTAPTVGPSPSPT